MLRFRKKPTPVLCFSEVRNLTCRVCVGPSVGWIEAVLAGAPDTLRDSEICLSGGPRTPRFLAGHVNLLLANFGIQKVGLSEAIVWAGSLKLQTIDSRIVLALGREFPPELSEMTRREGPQTLLATESFFSQHCSVVCTICHDGRSCHASLDLVSSCGGPNCWFVFRQ